MCVLILKEKRLRIVVTEELEVPLVGALCALRFRLRKTEAKTLVVCGPVEKLPGLVLEGGLEGLEAGVVGVVGESTEHFDFATEGFALNESVNFFERTNEAIFGGGPR